MSEGSSGGTPGGASSGAKRAQAGHVHRVELEEGRLWYKVCDACGRKLPVPFGHRIRLRELVRRYDEAGFAVRFRIRRKTKEDLEEEAKRRREDAEWEGRKKRDGAQGE